MNEYDMMQIDFQRFFVLSILMYDWPRSGYDTTQMAPMVWWYKQFQTNAKNDYQIWFTSTLVFYLGLFTLAGREKHVAILAVHSTEGFLLVCILVGYIVWQKTAKEKGSISFDRQQCESSCKHHVML